MTRDGQPGDAVVPVACDRCGREATEADRVDWYVWGDPSRAAAGSPIEPGSLTVYCCPECLTERDRDWALRLGDLDPDR